ncbi:hypothetical protein C3943_04145 [Lysinibacillus sp. B2A1]|nr:hypothetical protein C3943_04145 [Lysinibacillus sp. B2A1]
MSISVIVPIFNAEKFIEETLISLSKISKEVEEFIFIDDCSNDQSIEILEKYTNKLDNVKIIKNKINLGVSVSRNIGIKEAVGEWILFCDADDLIEKSIIVKYQEVIEKENIHMIYSNYIQIDNMGKRISSIMKGQTLTAMDGFCEMVLRNTIISPSGCLVKKNVLVEIGGFDKTIKVCEDVDLWLKILLKKNIIKHCPSVSTFIRRHRSNTTNEIIKANLGEKYILEKYGLDFLEIEFLRRNQSIDKNILDYTKILMRFNKFNKALKLIETINIYESSILFDEYLFQKAILNIKVEAFEEAKEYLNEIIKINRQNGAAINNLGVLLAKENKIVEASTLFLKAISIFPNYLDAAHNLAILNENQDDYKFTWRELRSELITYIY